MNKSILRNPIVWTVATLVVVILSSILIWSASRTSQPAAQPVATAPTGPKEALQVPAATEPVPLEPSQFFTNGNGRRGRRGGRGGVGMATDVDHTEFDAQIKARQAVKETTNEIIISLNAWTNAALSDPMEAGSPNVSLATLPVGNHIYGGVPFDVQGVIRLAGQMENLVSADGPQNTKTWPQQVAGIKIGRKFKILHLFHGGLNVNPDHATLVAKLVLHFADGSQTDLNLIAGSQMLMFYGPYDPPMLPFVDAPRTELGWVAEPGLHVYRSSFDNPKPDQEATTVDYVSGLSIASPFLVGLTIE